MNMLYSISAREAGGSGFYFSDDKNAPADAIRVSTQDVETAINAPAGTSFDFDANGKLTVTPAPAQTDAQIKAASDAAKWAAYQAKARAALTDSDTSMLRIYEAVILGDTTMEAPDVVAFVKWRQELRAILSTAQPEEIPDALPAMPAYPVGTGTTSTTTTEAQS
jgi:hypothetical protein